MASLHRIFGTISKFTKQSDGSLVVEGIASSETVDQQGEIVKADAMRAALPDFMKFANVREMHQPIAAGKALSVSVDDAGVTHIEAHVVDAGSVAKVEAGVLQGFSIGGSVPPGGRNKDNAKVIEALKLTEISLVDRPANPDAVITLVKMDGGEPVTEPVTKGMYQVGWAAELCASLSALASDTAWEAEYEGDDSPVPGKLKSVVTELCAALVALVQEETAELVAQHAGEPEADVVGMASKPGTLKKSEKLAAIAKAFLGAAKGEPVEKKGKKFSKATSEAIGAIHKCVKDAHEKLGALGYEDAEEKDDEVGMAAKSAELTKRATDAEVAKAAALADLAKAEEATKLAGDALKKVLAERDALTKQLAEAKVELSRKPLKAFPVERGADDPAVKADAKPVPGAPAPLADAAALVKAIHATGGTTPAFNRNQ